MPAVVDVFLAHGGLQYAETSELATTLDKVDQSSFIKAAQLKFENRLMKYYPSLFLAAAATNKVRITWDDWCRFELNEKDSKESGKLWVEVNSTDLEKGH